MKSNTYLCLVLVVTCVSKDLKGQACLTAHCSFSSHNIASYHVMYSLASIPLLLIPEDKGGPTTGH